MTRKTFIKLVSLLILSSFLLGVSFAEGASSFSLYLLEKELEEAEFEKAHYDSSTGAIVTSYQEGSFILPEMELEPFEYLVISWNSLTPGESSLEIEARLYHDEKDQWSQWFSWGLWEKSPRRRSFSGQDSLAQLSYDTAWVLGSEVTSSKVQVRGKLTGETSLRRIALTTRNTMVEEKKAIKKDHPGKVLGQAAYSQLLRHPMMADVMCSALTMATQLEILGEDYLPEEVALASYDGDLGGYGNWSFSLAMAGEAGYRAYVSYADEEELLRLLDAGYPLGMSVAYSDKEGGSLPYLEGAPTTTGGHLITLRGYEWQEDELYFLVSDSAAKSDEEAKILYKSSQLMEAWSSRIVYVLEEKEVEGTLIKRLPLEFKKEGEGLVSLEGDMPQEIPPTFNSQSLREPGRGLLAYKKEGEAGLNYGINMTKEGYLSLPEDLDLKSTTIYLISNTGLSYVASFKEELEEIVPEERLEAEEEKKEPPLEEEDNGPLLKVGFVLTALAFLFYRKKIKS